jgi:Tol biopolymer transport system component
MSSEKKIPNLEELMYGKVDSTKPKVDSTNISKKSKNTNRAEKKKSNKQSPKVESTKTNVESTNNHEIPINSQEKILDDEVIWQKLCDLRKEKNASSLFCLLTGKTSKTLSKLSKTKVDYKRLTAVNGLIKLYRILKREGYF